MANLFHPARLFTVVVVAAAAFIPDPPTVIERNLDLDIELVRFAAARYRGITATFEELTRAYALTAYNNAELLAWDARASQRFPDTETLVTGRFRVDSVRAEADTIDAVRPLRARVDKTLNVTWRLSTLSSVQVAPGNDYARDAINTLRHTIDGSLHSMVLLRHETTMLSAPPDTAVGTDTTADTIGVALQGEILLRQQQRHGWSEVRVPAGDLMGWVADSLLMNVNPQ